MKCLLTILLALAAGCTTHGPLTEQSRCDSTNGLAIKSELKPSCLRPGEDAVLTVTFRNVSRKAIAVPRGYTFMFCSLRDSKGQLVRPYSGNVDYEPVRPSDFITIPPSSAITNGAVFALHHVDTARWPEKPASEVLLSTEDLMSYPVTNDVYELVPHHRLREDRYRLCRGIFGAKFWFLLRVGGVPWTGDVETGPLSLQILTEPEERKEAEQ